MDFLMACKKTQSQLDRLEKKKEDLDRNMKIKQNSVLTFEDEKKLDGKIDDIIASFMQMSEDVKKRIQENMEATAKLKEKDENRQTIGLRESHTLGHSKRLAHLLNSFQNVQYEFRKREKNKLKETYLIACPDATDEEVEELEDSEKAEKLLAAAFALGSHSAKAILNQAMDRKKKIDQIVQKINILVGLIEEIDKIVNENTDVVDKIVLTLETAAEETEQAVKELETARTFQDWRNYIVRMFGYTVFIVVMIVIAAVVFRFISNSGVSTGSGEQ